MSTIRQQPELHLFLRPEGLLGNGALKRFEDILGITPETMFVRLPVFEFGEQAVWPVTVEQLRKLSTRSEEYSFRKDYLVFALTRRRDRQTGRFMAKLVTKSYLDELLKTRVVSRRSHSGQPAPSYEYFVHALGGLNAATITKLLSSLGLPYGDEDLVLLELGPRKKIPAWLISRDIMFILRQDGQLNPWRRNLFYRRQTRTGAVTCVPEEYFQKIRPHVLKRNMRRAIKLERNRGEQLTLAV